MYYPSSTAMPSGGGEKNVEHLLFARGKCVAVAVPALVQTCCARCESGSCPRSLTPWLPSFPPPQDVFMITNNVENRQCRRDPVFSRGLCCFPKLPAGSYM